MLEDFALKLFISGYLPEGHGPLDQTMYPVLIAIATSYLRPNELNLCLYHLYEKA